MTNAASRTQSNCCLWVNSGVHSTGGRREDVVVAVTDSVAETTACDVPHQSVGGASSTTRRSVQEEVYSRVDDLLC